MNETPKRRREWWIKTALFFLGVQLALLLIPQFRPGFLGAVCWLFGSDRLLWLGLAILLGLGAVVTSLVRRPFWTRWRAGGFALLGVLAVSPMCFRVYPSSHQGTVSEVRFRVPLDGPVTVGWGGDRRGVNYHVVAADQRWAYDLLVTHDGQTYRGDGERLEDYFCYGLPVLSPADGVVRATYLDARDVPVGLMGSLPAGGNQVVIEVAEKQFLFLCHLQPGSIAVKPGDRVKKGQAVGRVGNSGNTSEPHLHVHLQDTPEDHLGEGIPLYFHDYRVGGELVKRGMPTGGIRNGQFIGQIIEHVGEDSAH